MKGTTRQTRTKANRTPRVAAARVQAKARPGAGNRHRANALERQADDLAGRALHGERNLGRRVTHTAAAGYRAPASPGSSLPQSVREEMERAFAADFGLVRIHADAEAASAAREQGALAFTSGRHIFFSERAFAPHTEAGKHLLAHELTHVLQQTGDAKGDGRMAATHRQGSADVQREDPAAPPVTPEQRFERLAAVYDAHKTQTDVVSTIDEVRTMLGGRLAGTPPRPAFGEAFAQAVTNRTFDTRSGEARGFVHDCLKQLGFFNEAFLLLDRDIRLEIKTAVFLPGFITHLQNLRIPAPQVGEVSQMNLSSLRVWLSEALRHSSFRDFWPRGIIANYRRFLLRPHLPPPPADARLLQAHADVMARTDESPMTRGLMPQERVTMAWEFLRGLDAFRVMDCEAIRTEHFREGTYPTAGVRHVLEALREREQSIADTPSEPAVRRRLADELLVVITEISPIVQAALGQAIELGRFLGSMSSDTLFGDRAVQFPVPRVEHAVVGPIHASLLASARAMFPADADTQLPDAATYSRLVAAFRTDLERATTVRGRPGPSALENLDDAIRAEWTRGPRGRERAQSLYVFAAVLDELLALAGRYDATLDAATPDFADERAAHRIRLARALAQVSRWMQWTELRSVAARVLEPGAQDTRLWLVGEWEADEALPPERLIQDFPESADRPILGDAPITARHLALWFRLEYNRRLRALMIDILANEARLAPDTRLGLRRINELVESAAVLRERMRPSAQEELNARAAGSSPTLLTLQMPHRFHVSDFVAVVPEHPTKTWSEVIATRQKTRVTFGLDQAEAPGYIFVDNPDQGVFGWILPPLGPLYRVLREMRSAETLAVRRLMAERGLNETDARALLETLTDADWVARISADSITEADFADLEARLTGRLEAQNRPIAAELPDLWRRLTILRRRLLVLQQQLLLAPYLADRRVIGGPSGESPEAAERRRNAPQHLIDAMWSFGRNVRPVEETDDQVALLVLMLAAEIDGIITGGRMEGDYARQLYPYIDGAIQAAEDPERVRQMRRLTNEYDPAGGIVYIDARLNEAVAHLRSARDAVDLAFAEAQAATGYGTEEDSSAHGGLVIVPIEGSRTPIFPSPQTNPNHEWVRGWRRGADGRPDLIGTGVRYRLLSINHPFRFHPHLGSPTDRPGLAARYVDLRTEPPADSGTASDLLFTVHVTNQTNQATNTVQVHATDTLLLEEFFDVFLWRSFQVQMENLSAMTQASMDWMLTGVGAFLPPVAAADVGVRFGHMIASGELDELVRMIRDDPQELFTRIYERLRDELFRPERIWRFLLLSGQHPFLPLRTMRPTAQRRQLPPRTRLARIVHTLTTIGIRIAEAGERLKLRVRGPLRSAQSNIAARPTVAWLLTNAVHWAEILPDLIPPLNLEGLEDREIPTEASELIDLLRQQVDEMEGDARESVVRLLEGIRHFELPGELLNLGAVTELIIAFVLDRFGARARAVRLAMELIPVPSEHQGRFTGFRSVFEWVSETIADSWRGSPADPNEYWRASIVPLIVDKFRETRDELVEGVYQSINRFLRSVNVRELAPPAALPETEVSAEAIDAEAEASPRDGESLRPEAWRLPAGAGAPLDPVERRRFEQTFGASFRHVRVHRGAEGEAATDPVGADAVTSGSHIYLHPEAAQAGTSSTRLLAHELTHVVQQTGLTPPTQHPGPPRRGKDGRGLRIHEDREETARRIGDRVVNREALEDEERDALMERAEGIQPSIGERTVNDIITELTTITSSEEFTQDPTGATPAGPVPGLDDARAIWTAALAALTSATFSALPSFLSAPPEVKQGIQAKVRSSDARVNGELQNIARLAQRPKPGPHAAGAATTELSPGRFAQLLEGFLYGETGVALQITLGTTDHRFERVAVINLSLARMNDSALWRLAVERSFTTDRDVIERELRQRLVALRDIPGMEMGLWDRTIPFKFSSDFIADFTRMRDRRAARPGVAANLPTMADYTNDASPRGDVLAVSTHGLLTRGDRTIGAHDRQSHHTTQFLLVEYFENRNARKAFPLHHRYPGNEFSATDSHTFGVMFTDPARTRVQSISAAGRTLDLRRLDDSGGRGDSMPAVLIAARTHQRGDLHILGESRWEAGASDEDKGGAGQRRTQSLAIENTFTRNLRPELRPRNDSVAERATFAQEVNRDPAAAARQFFDAAVATYHWMHSRMIPALERALRTEELAYYTGLAAINHPGTAAGTLDQNYRLEAHHLDRIFTRARANNNTIMSAAGWPTP